MTSLATYDAPPMDAVMPAHAQVGMTVLFGATAVLALGWALIGSARRRDPIFLILVVGGALSFVLEPEFAVLSQRWYPRPGSWEVFTVYDRSFPIFQLLADVALVGGLIAYAHWQLGRGLRPEAVWRLFAIEAIVLTAFEIVPVAAGTSIFFGLHPSAAFDVPLWVPISKAAAGIAGAAAVGYLLPRLTRGSRILLLPILPIGIGALQAAMCWPVWVALGGQWGTAANLAASFTVIGLSLLAVHVVATSAAPARGSNIGDARNTTPAVDAAPPSDGCRTLEEHAATASPFTRAGGSVECMTTSAPAVSGSAPMFGDSNG